MTEWLDGMSLVDTTRYQTNNGVFRVGFPQDMVSNDPGLRALLQIGSNSVPVLVKRIVEPPEPEVKGFWIRLRLRLQQKWIQIRRSGYSAPPAVYPHRQQARKLAAAFTLMALGTNANGGFGRALEAYAATPALYRSVSWDLRGGIPLARAVIMAMNNLPERKAEIVADIVAGLNHANAAWREGAVSSAGIYRDELPVWKKRIIELTHDSDENVRCSALSCLVNNAPEDPEIIRLAEDVLRNRTNPARLRAISTRVRLNSTNLLPVLYEASREPDGELRRRAHEAIQRMERSH